RSHTMYVLATNQLVGLLAAGPGPLENTSALTWIVGAVGVLIVLAIPELLGMRYIPNNRVGIVEKLWSSKGSVSEGRIIALTGEAGYQADILRGGIHFSL